MKPIQVTPKNETHVFINTYGASKRGLIKKSHKFITENTTVRRKYKRKPFDKGYYPNWTDTTYKVSKVSNVNTKPMYTVKDERGNLLKGRFYNEDIQPIKTDRYRVEKILNRRKRNGKIEYFIKWLNYPSSYNSWEPAENIKNLY
ncbi:hypothetical protein B4U80_00497 [Leptotrombidium deliense]|uniref:Chromo domain-containing protein n=1 Tax=Leptotrombidium deliense TaxID=299467 RepID=A0A443Q8C9_9ACAR|nr:hypothetical protein B4U80_00497 [Leptotrombidium deliense]